ncbi:MAG: ATP-grasp domain-containing protein [Alkalibacterium sp.]|nr:ATP-grasp domain-containing protein [Alkalibacterium sp.]
MKKLLLLGGSPHQLPAIEYAKNKGIYTILCDYLTDNPGQYIADKFYLTSTTDKNAILEVGRKESIDGIISYASDPAAPTAAFVAEKLGLASNPLKSVEILAYKDRFREYLLNNGFFSPKAKSFTDKYIAKNQIGDFLFPILIKPIDSSGSKGITKIYSMTDFDTAFDNAIKTSRDKVVIVEEFVEQEHPYMVGGDIYVDNGKVVYWGLLNCHRNYSVNALIPIGKSYPLLIEDEKTDRIKTTVQRLISELNIKFGGFNLECIVDKNNNVFLIELGPRNGGNYIPEFLKEINKVDMIAATVEHALGFDYEIIPRDNKGFYSSFNIHSEENGYLKEITIEQTVEQRLFFKNVTKKKNDYIEYFDGANKSLGTLFMKHKNHAQLMETMTPPFNWINISLKKQNE